MSNDSNFSIFVIFFNSLLKIDTSLRIKKYSGIFKISHFSKYQKLDIDEDGKDEIILPGQNANQFVISRYNSNYPVYFSLKEDFKCPVFSINKSNKSITELFLDTEEYSYYFSCKISLVHKYWYVMYLIVSMLIYLLFYIAIRVKELSKLKVESI